MMRQPLVNENFTRFTYDVSRQLKPLLILYQIRFVSFIFAALLSNAS